MAEHRDSRPKLPGGAPSDLASERPKLPARGLQGRQARTTLLGTGAMLAASPVGGARAKPAESGGKPPVTTKHGSRQPLHLGAPAAEARPAASGAAARSPRPPPAAPVPSRKPPALSLRAPLPTHASAGALVDAKRETAREKEELPTWRPPVPISDPPPSAGSEPVEERSAVLPSLRLRQAPIITDTEEDAPDSTPPRPSLVGLQWIADDAASVLIVGEGYAMRAALEEALQRHGLETEHSTASAAVQAVLAATPNLVLIAGDASADGGGAVLSQLASAELTSTVPVVVLASDRDLGTRLEATRRGALTVLPPSASVDAVAAELARLLKERKSGAAPALASVGETTLRELLGVIERRVVAALATRGAKPSPAGARGQADWRLTLGSGAELGQVLDDLSTRIERAVVRVEPLAYELGPESADAFAGDATEAEQSAAADIAGLRVILVDDDSMRADAMARELRARGAVVVVSGLAPDDRRLQGLRQLDPTAVLVRADDLATRGGPLLDSLRRDVRLRWAAMVVAEWGGPSEAMVSVAALLGRLAATLEPEQGLAARARLAQPFDARLEAFGPARSLRALGRVSPPRRVTVHNPRATVQVDLADGILVGARAKVLSTPAQSLEGPAALAVLLILSSGRVTVEPIDEPGILNLMTPVETALEVASAETPLLAASLIPAAQRFMELPTLPRHGDTAALGALAAEEAASHGPTAPGLAAAIEPAPESAPAARVARRGLHLTLAAAASVMIAAVVGLVVYAASMTPAGQSTQQLGLLARVRSLLALDPSAGAVGSTVPTGGLSSAAAGAGRAAADPRSNGAARDGSVGAATLASGSLLEKARSGDAEAIAALEARSPERRGIDEALALSAGRTAQRRAEVDSLLRETSAHTDKLADPAFAARWLAFARDPALAPDALRALASVPSAAATDLLYEAWVGTPGRTTATQLAEELLYVKSVRSHASPALAAALDLREAESCEQTAAVVERASAVGDRRSLHLLGKLIEKRGCGDDKRRDCYPCLGRRKTVARAIREVRRRKEPTYVRQG